MDVASLEDYLFGLFPRSTAEPWDHVGLSVGDPASEISRVAVALDATPATVDEAASQDANVLLTHHPVYIKAPDAFVPEPGTYPQASATIYRAAQAGVSIISMHTNLDRAPVARERMAEALGLTCTGSLEAPCDDTAPGLGGIAEAATPEPLSIWAERAAKAFATEPRVWGNPAQMVSRVALLGGSLSDLGELALQQGADMIVCGEAGYHVCQDLTARGCSVVLLGHDASEYPFVDILVKVAQDAGVAAQDIVRMNRSRQWWTAREGIRG